mmetsp:Transcript_48/g.99  ORF Transcript_48/g.99 Transcript_48/m.99 type:complete len:220 (+) Transcript_48:766-1425(+)
MVRPEPAASPLYALQVHGGLAGRLFRGSRFQVSVSMLPAPIVFSNPLNVLARGFIAQGHLARSLSLHCQLLSLNLSLQDFLFDHPASNEPTPNSSDLHLAFLMKLGAHLLEKLEIFLHIFKLAAMRGSLHVSYKFLHPFDSIDSLDKLGALDKAETVTPPPLLNNEHLVEKALYLPEAHRRDFAMLKLYVVAPPRLNLRRCPAVHLHHQHAVFLRHQVP